MLQRCRHLSLMPFRRRDFSRLALARTPPFALERYFAEHEFSCKISACSSDTEAISLNDVLALMDAETRRLWDEQSLGYTEVKGHPAMLALLGEAYGLEPHCFQEVAPQEGILLAYAALLEPGDGVVCTAPRLPVVPHVRRAGRRRGDLLAMSRGRERRALRRRRPCEGVRRDAEPQGCKCELPAQSDRCTAVFGGVGAHRRHLRGARRVPLRRRDLPGPRPEDARERGDGLRQGYQPRRAVEEHGHARRADRVARDAGRPLSATRRRAPGLHDDLLVGALPNLGDGRVTK